MVFTAKPTATTTGTTAGRKAPMPVAPLRIPSPLAIRSPSNNPDRGPAYSPVNNQDGPNVSTQESL